MWRNLLCAGAIALGFGSSASAVTVIHEGGGLFDPNGPGVLAPTVTLGDFNNPTGNPLITVTGETWIFGGVRNGAGATNWRDGWAMDFGNLTYDLVFRWTNLGAGDFDGQIRFGGDNRVILRSGFREFENISGNFVEFSVDPIFGKLGPQSGGPDEDIVWSLHATVVPLPAGGLLLLSGLAAFGLLSRRRTQTV